MYAARTIEYAAKLRVAGSGPLSVGEIHSKSPSSDQ